MPLIKPAPRPSPAMHIAVNPCPTCAASRKAGRRGIYRRIKGIFRKAAAVLPPSVCHACGTTGLQATGFSKVNWNPEARADRRADKPVGSMEEARNDAVFVGAAATAAPRGRTSRSPAPPPAAQPRPAHTMAPRRRPTPPPLTRSERRRRSSTRWELWSKHRVGRTGRPIRRLRFRSSAPNGLAPIREAEEPEE
ncbi:hypothetical protein EsH8_IV_000783 [Colletotrichum jinshuiense]